MITSSDPRIVRLATAWEVTPDLISATIAETHSTRAARGVDYEPDDLLNAACAVLDVADAVDAAIG
jgi:hypothetical protein